MNKVLIIKLGFSETLRDDGERACSYGDVIRTTVLLNYFDRRKWHVTWLADASAIPFLNPNPRIDRVMQWGIDSTLVLQQETFDLVVNLEKVPGACALTNLLSGDKYGFRWDGVHARVKSYNHADRVLDIVDSKKSGKVYWQSHLARVIRRRWRPSDKYVLSKPNVPCVYDIGLNWKVGSKWQNKGWNMENWSALDKMLEEKGFHTSYQPRDINPREYMEWIAECKLVVTCDTLGMHLALGYGKKVVALFGPSPSSEVYLYDQGEIILPQSEYGCIPCLKPTCPREISCINLIQPEEVVKVVERVMNETN